MSKKSYRNNDGFSLVELIIAIAILTVFVGAASLSIAMIRSADTKGLANGINNSLTDLKSITEAHTGPYYLHIYKTDGGFYASFDDDATFTVPDEAPSGDEKLGSSNLTVTYSNDGVEANEVEITGAAYITIRIQKKDGAFSEDEGALTVPKYFAVLNGSDRDYKVILAKNTGLHYVEQI